MKVTYIYINLDIEMSSYFFQFSLKVWGPWIRLD